MEAAEMWFIEKIMRVPWTDRVGNKGALEKSVVNRQVKKYIRSRQLKFLGHMLWQRGLESDWLLGRVGGREARGGQRAKFMNSLPSRRYKWKLSVAKVVRLADERERWRSIICWCHKNGTLVILHVNNQPPLTLHLKLQQIFTVCTMKGKPTWKYSVSTSSSPFFSQWTDGSGWPYTLHSSSTSSFS